ncbi:hypothetical protein [Homoserinibacter sp. GY 40078]|uniref:hypothetical protein n=1 Tax=Homoserinibacter sp. GY 40078 TaxID=2603275 RepID=UPI0011CB17B9|nr:hypothetical protein [Homoserinibacter sp. GY 40078]TXK17721.1 hypothetical protein FVQ89_13045 [Homoserinibacter sp. GY 40078]
MKELPRREARQVFKRCMDTKAARIEMLASLLLTSGVELTTSDAGVQAVNDWFFTYVEADPERPGWMLPIWYSVCHDVALFLGDVMIERHPNLRWEFHTWGKRKVAYQSHVIMGFSTEDPKFHTCIMVEGGVVTYGSRIIASRGSIATYGTVEIRGQKIDIDAVVAGAHNREVETDAFARWMKDVDRRA